MPLKLDHNRLRQLAEIPFSEPSPDGLRREGEVFFIGGNLPVYETLETMYDSYCQESSGLFHLTFGGAVDLERNLELVRQIKKNFSVRLMGRVNYPVTVQLAEQAYLAGLDLLDMPCPVEDDGAFAGHENRVRQAAGIFPRWSLVSSLPVARVGSERLRRVVDLLLQAGAVPLPVLLNGGDPDHTADAKAVFQYVSSAWRDQDVQIRPLLPLIRLVTPLGPSGSAGFIRNVINRLQDRRQMVASDLRRHLRTSGAEASFDSAGL